MEFKKGYYYLTVNNQLKHTPAEEVSNPAFFTDDPFIKQFWSVDTEKDYITMLMHTENIVYADITEGKHRKVMRHE